MSGLNVIISRPRAKLADLPALSEISFTDLYPWSPVSTTTAVKILGVDRGTWAVWRNRGIAPVALPSAWFKPTTGHPIVFRIDHIKRWLSERRGEPYSGLGDWFATLATEFGSEATSAAQARRLAAMYARAAGPQISDVTFRASGFEAYIASLGAAP